MKWNWGIKVNMRFLSRAKRHDNREWVHGYYTECLTCNKIENIIIFPERSDIFKIAVDPKTLCQCTGVLDKHAAYIYENDILKISGETRFSPVCYGIVVWTHGMWLVNFSDKISNILSECLHHFCCEIVGNTIDNTEALK